MKLTVLVDNNTLIDQYYFGEPGLSFFIEDEDKKILFDMGYSDLFMKNACEMGISLSDISYVVLSHGHLDHSWGLSHLMESLETRAHKDNKITFIAHPLALCTKTHEGESIGFKYSEEELKRYFNVNLSKSPIWISEKLVYLGQIERTNDFENKSSIGITMVENVQEDDFLLDDSALVYKSNNGLVIITGCSHSGICNIIEYAKKLCSEERILDIIGGFHLLCPSQSQLINTQQYLKEINPVAVHACHCTDLPSKIALSKVVDLQEVGVGLTLEFL